MLKSLCIAFGVIAFSPILVAKKTVSQNEETLEASLSKVKPLKSSEVEIGSDDAKRKIKFHRLSKKRAEKPLKDHRTKEQKKADEYAAAARQEAEAKYIDSEGNFTFPKRHDLIFMSASELENGQHYLRWTDGSTAEEATALSNLDFGSMKPTITIETEETLDTILLFHFPYFESSPMNACGEDLLDDMPSVSLSETRTEFAVVEGSRADSDMDSIYTLDALHVVAEESPEKVKRDKDENPPVVKKKPKKKKDMEVYFWPIKSEKHKD